MKNLKLQLTSLIFLLFLSGLSLAASNSINGLRVWDSPDGSRLIFDLKTKPRYEIFRLENPHRIVIDLKQTRQKTKTPQIKRNHQIIKNVRTAARNNKSRRIVIDTKGKTDFRSYGLLPNREYGHRLVIELNQKNKPANVASLKKPGPAKNATPVKKPAQTRSRKSPEDILTASNSHSSKKTTPAPKKSNYRDIIIAIDAGHGGEDPGALGRKGTQEKHVALRIAKKLKKAIDREKGFRGVLVRKGDYYLTLRRRMEIARENKADMFISVHADAYKNPRVKGSSVFILSERGASDEAAKWLAKQENSADLIGGVSLDDKDKTLAMVLLDLSQTATIDASGRVAKNLLSEIKKVGPVHNKTVQHARFVVLKSPDIPSVLVETAFISNPREERRLNDTRYQQKLANAMLKGVKKYFKQNPPPNTQLAQANNRTVRVAPGDTLSKIAQTMRVSIADIKSLNQMRSEKLFAGQVLHIPF